MIKNYLKCDSARALFPEQRAVGYPDVVTVQGFVGLISGSSIQVVYVRSMCKDHY